MAYQKIEGMPGLFRDTLNGKLVNIRELPMLDPRLDSMALQERFVELIREHIDPDKAIEALAKYIEELEYPEPFYITPSLSLALANNAYVVFLSILQKKPTEIAQKHFGDLLEAFGATDG